MMNQEEKRNRALEIISKDPYRIVKGNPIINAKYEISAIQAKIFLHMISKIDITQPNFQEITIGVQEFAQFANIDSKDLYKIVRTESVKLMDKKIAYEDDKITLDSVLLASVVYNKRQGTYTFEFPKKLSPFLVQLKDNFTAYDLHNVLTLESAYSIRFFEFCKQYEKIGKFTFGVEELKEVFGITDKYKNYFDFKKKVILQAEKELKEHCELYFSFKEKKEGKKIVELLFLIHKNAQKIIASEVSSVENKKAEIVYKSTANPAIDEIFKLVEQYGVSMNIIEKWFTHYPPEQIKASVLYSLKENEMGRVKEMAKYLQTMVKIPTIFQQQEQLKNEQEKKKNKKNEHKKNKLDQQDFENNRDKLQMDFYKALTDLILERIQGNDLLHIEIFNKLKSDYNQEKREFLTDLAYNNLVLL
jgi:plasmid replication initiation protein